MEIFWKHSATKNCHFFAIKFALDDEISNDRPRVLEGECKVDIEDIKKKKKSIVLSMYKCLTSNINAHLKSNL